MEQQENKSTDIKEIFIEGEKVYLKKSGIFGWGVVHPYIIDGKKNLKNLLFGGSLLKLVITIFVVLIILGFFFEHAKILEIANECLNNNTLINLNNNEIR